VVELGAVGLRLGRETLEKRAVLVEQNGLRPAGTGRGVRRELVEIEAPQDSEVVVADQADPGSLTYELDHLVRPWPVPDEVADAPDLVRRVGVDCLEDGLERV
jgi:hypothetical protein